MGERFYRGRLNPAHGLLSQAFHMVACMGLGAVGLVGCRSDHVLLDYQHSLQRPTLAVYFSRSVRVEQDQESSVLWSRAEDTALQLDEWITNVFRLCLRLDAFERDKLLSDEMTAVPAELDQLKQRLEGEKDPEILSKLKQVIESKRQQHETLLALEQRMKQAELQLEQSLTAIATVDSQIRLLDAQDVDSGRSERLYADVREQVNRLNDLIGSINEVYDYNSQFIPPPG
jgi:hypothetical protein